MQQNQEVTMPLDLDTLGRLLGACECGHETDAIVEIATRADLVWTCTALDTASDDPDACGFVNVTPDTECADCGALRSGVGRGRGGAHPCYS